MKSPVNGKIIAIAGILLILAALVIFRGQRKIISAPPESLPKSENQFLPPAKENVAPSLISHIDLLKKKVEEHPDDIVSITALAQLLMDSHKPEEAIVYFNKGLNVQPANDSLLLDLAVCYFTILDYSKAMEVTDKILKRNKNHPTALLNKGIIFAVQKKNDSAAMAFHRVITVAPKSDEAVQANNYLAQIRTQQ